MVGSSTWLTRFTMLPKRAITFGASLAGMWMICATSRLNGKPSLLRTVMVLKFLSSMCASLRALAQLSTKLVVGTSSTFIVYLLMGYLPGPSGSIHTPRKPFSTMLPCLKVSPVRSLPSSPMYDITTPTKPIGTSVIGISSICCAQGFM